MTESQLLEEIYRALNGHGPDDAFTTQELADALGLQPPATRKRLKVAIRAGKVQPCKIRRENMFGEMQTIKAYRLRPES